MSKATQFDIQYWLMRERENSSFKKNEKISSTKLIKALLQPMSSTYNKKNNDTSSLPWLSLLLLLGLAILTSSSSVFIPSTQDEKVPRKLVSRLLSGNEFVGKIKNDNKSQVRKFHFIIEEHQGVPDGIQKSLLVVNGQYPGPTIEMNSNDRLLVHVENKLNEPTLIHWPALHQTKSNKNNNNDIPHPTKNYNSSHHSMECGIPPGKSRIYDLLSNEFSVGTFWWYAHLESQRGDGINGFFIVHSNEEKVPYYDYDVVLHLSDLYHSKVADLLRVFLSANNQLIKSGKVPQPPAVSPVPDSGTINGFGQYFSNQKKVGEYYRLKIKNKKIYRLRLVNTGLLAFIRFSIDSHKLIVIEADGINIKPIMVDSLTLGVAQRYSVLVKMDQKPDAYWIHLEIPPTSFSYVPHEANHHILAILTYLSSNTNPLNPPTVVRKNVGIELSTINMQPVTTKPVLEPAETYLVRTTFRNNSTNSKNASDWSYYGRSAIISNSKKEVIDIILENSSPIAFTFNLRGYSFWIMGSGSGEYPLNPTLGPTISENLISSLSHLTTDPNKIPSKTMKALRELGIPNLSLFTTNRSSTLESKLKSFNGKDPPKKEDTNNGNLEKNQKKQLLYPRRQVFEKLYLTNVLKPFTNTQLEITENLFTFYLSFFAKNLNVLFIPLIRSLRDLGDITAKHKFSSFSDENLQKNNNSQFKNKKRFFLFRRDSKLQYLEDLIASLAKVKNPEELTTPRSKALRELGLPSFSANTNIEPKLNSLHGPDPRKLKKLKKKNLYRRQDFKERKTNRSLTNNVGIMERDTQIIDSNNWVHLRIHKKDYNDAEYLPIYFFMSWDLNVNNVVGLSLNSDKNFKNIQNYEVCNNFIYS